MEKESVEMLNRSDHIKDRSYYVWERKRDINKMFSDAVEYKIDIYTLNKKYSKAELKELLTDLKKREAFLNLLSYYEMLSKAVKDGFYDYEIISSLGKVYIIKIYENVFKNYIALRKEELEEEIYSNLTWLYKELKK